MIEGSESRAKEVKAVKEAYEANKDDVASRVWEKMKHNPDYKSFMEFIEGNGISGDMLESAYSASECSKMYSDWKFGREVDF